ncbi:MAG: M28 family peptidase [Deltaproteobacteria bacterium]|nr:M28 family peptidase [Deltaproteobacteria bacterium]
MPNPTRIDMMDEIRTLCALPPRLPCSEGERRGHEHVASRLAALGLQPSTEPFRFQANGYARFAAHAGLLWAAGTIGLAAPWLGTALSAAANASFFGDLESRWFWLARLLPAGPSQNVVARIPAAGEVRERVVLMAHVDVAREGPPLFFAPERAKAAARFFRRELGGAPNPVQLVFWSGVAQTALQALGLAGLPTRLPQWALAQLHAFVALQMGRAAFSDPVPGASDDASGVAVMLAAADRLAAEPLAHTEVWVVATGCEEAMLGGALDFCDRHAPGLGAYNTWYLAIDTVGAGALRWCTGEGFLRRIPYDGKFVRLCREVAAEDGAPPARPYTMTFATDALVPAVRGLRAMALLALDEDDYPPNYHWHTDSPDNIDPRALDHTLDFTLRLLRRIDADAAR